MPAHRVTEAPYEPGTLFSQVLANGEVALVPYESFSGFADDTIIPWPSTEKEFNLGHTARTRITIRNTHDMDSVYVGLQDADLTVNNTWEILPGKEETFNWTSDVKIYATPSSTNDITIRCKEEGYQ